MEMEMGTSTHGIAATKLRPGQGRRNRDSAAQPPHQPPLATMPRSQLQALCGFSGKGTV